MGFLKSIGKAFKSVGGAVSGFFDSSLGGAALGVGSSLLGNVLGKSSAKDQRNFNASEALKQRDWQESQYKARYQQTMADMKTAGLNPMLAYRQGTGGGVPSGGQASASLGQEGQITTAAAARGIEAGLALATKKKIQQDTATSAAQQSKLIMDALKVEKETTLLSKEEPWALIMEQVAKEGVKPLLDYLLETYGTAKKRSNVNKGVLDLLPKVPITDWRWPNK